MFLEVAHYELFGRDLSHCVAADSDLPEFNGASIKLPFAISLSSFIRLPNAVTSSTRAANGAAPPTPPALGILGMDPVGQTVALRASKNLGSRIFYSDSRPFPELESQTGAVRLPIDTLVEQADLVCVVLPPLQGMTAWIGPRQIEALPPRKLFVARRRSESIERAVEHLSHHFAEHLPVADLARTAGLSESYFQHQFAAIIGMSPHRYQLMLRIFHAMAHLRGGMAIRDVAQFAGFADQSHLHRFFRRVVGVPPGQYQRRFAHG